MQKLRMGYYFKIVLLMALLVMGGSGVVSANISNSNNYQATDMEFGSSSTEESCSSHYCTKASIGDLSAGSSLSNEKAVEFGPIAADSEPMLEVIVTEGQSNLGVLRTDIAATKTTTVEVRNYLSHGYILQVIGDPPKYDGHALAAPKLPVASEPGTEQFAINAVANTSPEVGADPKQEPSQEFSFGFIEDGYQTANLFKYSSGDVIARSNSQSGQTKYTISMIVNVSGKTPAGHYSGDFSAVVIPVF